MKHDPSGTGMLLTSQSLASCTGSWMLRTCTGCIGCLSVPVIWLVWFDL
jgi:hypothetical protein